MLSAFHFAHEQSPHLDHRHRFSDTLPQHHSIFVGRNQFFDVLFEVLTNLKITQEGKYMDKTYNSEFSCDLIMGRHEQS